MPAGIYGQQTGSGTPVYQGPAAQPVSTVTATDRANAAAAAGKKWVGSPTDGHWVDENGNPIASPTATPGTPGAAGVDFSGAAKAVAPDPALADSRSATVDLERARALQNQLAAQAQGPRTAPQVAAPPTASAGQATAGQAVAPGFGGATMAAPVQFGPAVQASAALAGPAQQVAAQQLKAPTVGPTATSNAAMARAEDATAAHIDMSPQDQLRTRQLALADQLQGQAAGTGGPTAAGLQYSSAIDRAIAEQASQAANVRGTGRVTALLNEGDNVAQLSQEGARQSAILRAQEQQAAQGQLSNLLGTTRGTDVGLATSEAGLQQSTNLANSALNTNTNLANAGALNTSSQFNAGQQNDLTKLQAQLTEQQGEANQRTDLSAQQGNQGANLQTNLANAGAENTVGLANAGAGNAVNLAQGNAGLATNLANAGASNQLNLTSGQTAAQIAQLNAQLSTQASNTNAGLATQTNLANAAAAADANKTNANLSQNQMTIDDQKQAQNVLAQLQAQSQVLQTDDARAKNALLQQQIQAAINSGNKSWLSSLLGAGLGTIGAVLGGPIGGAIGTAIGGTAGKAASDAFQGDDG